MSFLRRRSVRRLLVVSAFVVAAVIAFEAWRARTDRHVPGEHEEGIVDSLGRTLPADRPRVEFVDATASAGLEFHHFPGVRSGKLPEDMGSGVALGDVDGDGWTDVFLVNSTGPMSGMASDWPGVDGRSRLFRNRGDGTFEDVTDSSGIELRALGMGAAFFDYDGDGDLDLFVTTYPRLRLFENDGRGHFCERTTAAGLASFEGFWTGIAVGDYDRDGRVDLYVCGYVKYRDEPAGAKPFVSQYGLDIPASINPSNFEPERNLLLHNRGDGTFEECGAACGVDDPTGRSLSAVFCDFDGDGWPDLYVANDVSDNAFYLNRRDGTFEDCTANSHLGDYRGAMGLAVGDFDGDLDPDIYITHWVSQENALYACVPAKPEDGVPSDGSRPGVPQFFDVADGYGLGATTLKEVGWATRFFDFDNDGRVDLFNVDGNTIPERGDPKLLIGQKSQLFWNAGARRGFYEVGAISGSFFRELHVGRGGATFDYDLDGDEDLIIVTRGEGCALLRNDGGNRNGSVRVRLRQPSGNRFALGSKLVATIAGVKHADWYESQGSYLSQHAVGESSFGLGSAAHVDDLEVVWPDGVHDHSGPIDADRIVTWVRGRPPIAEPFPGQRGSHANSKPSVEVQKRFYETRDLATKSRLAGDLDSAIASYERALALWPGHEDCLYYLGNCRLERGDESGALESFERLVELNPASSRGWMQIGRMRLPGGDSRFDDLDLAERAFERSRSINGEESRPVVELGVVALLRRDRAVAAKRFADAAQLNPKSVEARWLAGLTAYLDGDAPKALELLRAAHQVALGDANSAPKTANEGDTKSGEALVSKQSSLRAIFERWQSVAQREPDLDLEYSASVADLR